MAFSPNLFLSNIRGKDGLAKPCRFEVILPIPLYLSNFISTSLLDKILNFPNSIVSDITSAITGNGGNTSYSPTISRYLSLQCESAELPGKSLQTVDVKIYGPTFKIPLQTQFNDIGLTFLCTNEFYERKLFDRWIECINPLDTNNLRFQKEFGQEYLCQLTIHQYDEFATRIYSVDLMDAFPVSITSQPLSWADENFHRLTVQFAYQKFKTTYTTSINTDGLIGSVGSSLLSKVSPIGKAI